MLELGLLGPLVIPHPTDSRLNSETAAQSPSSRNGTWLHTHATPVMGITSKYELNRCIGHAELALGVHLPHEVLGVLHLDEVNEFHLFLASLAQLPSPVEIAATIVSRRR